MGNKEQDHIPVLLDKAVNYLNIKEDGIYIDATLGRGGHAGEILHKLDEEKGQFLGIDRDKTAVNFCRDKFSDHKNAEFFHENFVKLPDIIRDKGLAGADGILFDLGVSSPQIDNPERGFSYSSPAPLDMRMNRDNNITAADIINNRSKKEISRILKEYGEERWAERISEFICRRRKDQEIETTEELVEIIKDAIPASARRKGGHPARRTFQALRIATNKELESLEKIMKKLPGLLVREGRVCVISFHSLEDRIVKHSFKEHARECTCPPDFPICRCEKEKELEIITKSPVRADEKEVEKNPRARSARLRAAKKL
ncbi:16S rRNA (cytosine(1402)-N(4))-methyltransferase RsmH [Halarsenatibacter silvermanii]|uniref:Ribosomal RNA small subunit methyltransferase H n=1 Tax=Halarsenatibacter silvermanii TaxID=321763 RepID=A0A1G9JNN3_9FIRM|nr:16S rRNA (cytosine(1402)-N(4))-methyltransferase RsmH [Halarsenatibacter silvermanii]SDL39071.1 16S rRNA (cytosine1402-N4)-methyltransferase [Halarsenatibacter silvermanii]